MREHLPLLATILCVALFLNGLRFALADTNPYAGKSILGIPHHEGGFSVAQLNWMGKAQMIAALPIWALLMLVDRYA